MKLQGKSGAVFKVKKFKANMLFEHIMWTKRRGSERQISHQAIKADRKWDRAGTPNLHLGIKPDKN